MKLPSVYANKIDKDLKNNTDYFRGEKNVKQRDLGELKSLFDSNGYVNRLRVMFTLKDGKKVDEKLVLCKCNCFITLNNKRILFDDIQDYDIKK